MPTLMLRFGSGLMEGAVLAGGVTVTATELVTVKPPRWLTVPVAKRAMSPALSALRKRARLASEPLNQR